jgi:hypothetical protein
LLVQSNGSYPFSNPFAASSSTPSASGKETVSSTQLDQLKNDFTMIAKDLNPTERKLYHNLIDTENYQAAKGIVSIGFIRAAGLYQDSNGYPLSGESLSQDLTKLNPPSSQQEQNAIQALQNYLSVNPSSLALDKEKLGNLLDLKV